jgi:hypothetical protein
MGSPYHTSVQCEREKSMARAIGIDDDSGEFDRLFWELFTLPIHSNIKLFADNLKNQLQKEYICVQIRSGDQGKVRDVGKSVSEVLELLLLSSTPHEMSIFLASDIQPNEQDHLKTITDIYPNLYDLSELLLAKKQSLQNLSKGMNLPTETLGIILDQYLCSMANDLIFSNNLKFASTFQMLIQYRHILEQLSL